MPHYDVQAWCDRRFITVIDLNAGTPGQALEMARAQTDKLLDAAEECDGNYPWDEFAVYDEHGHQLLRTLDDDARVREVAHDLLAALQWLVDDLTDAGEDRNPETDVEYDSVASARAAIVKARG